ncbi:molecular chaperone DnaJ [Leptospira kobayashii]|uniref:Molecular chaperone DnaJ n=1 Tax=Leptospira kobayashii TaxID=1917830 RepID=A0ABN6K8W4_9LEPT|nr:J domain-containing protein [Leptospira kobayashii]BDA77407.1 molecular chaperone DnaJ [Leptospira kobayashii]
MGGTKKNNPPFPDYYETLELPYGATAEAIRTNFRRLAKFFHPDVPFTGSEETFIKIFTAYQTLSSQARTKYDEIYKKYQAARFLQKQVSLSAPIVLPPSRVTFSTGILDLAKRGLMRKGFRTKDRRKVTGINYDIIVHIKEKEAIRRVIALIPLTVRVVCRDCMGGDPHCSSCDGAGSYKSSRNLKVEFPPSTLQNNRLFEFDLSKFRPDSFTHFKKKLLRVKLHIERKIPLPFEARPVGK